jgi:ribosomal protein L40E
MKNNLFFCEHCGNPVPLQAKSCPHCGKFFDAVKCPQCGYTSLPERFHNGCPQCGYMSTSKERESNVRDVTDMFTIGKSDNGGAPVWLYWIVGLGLAFVIFVFIILFLKL